MSGRCLAEEPNLLVREDSGSRPVADVRLKWVGDTSVTSGFQAEVSHLFTEGER